MENHLRQMTASSDEGSNPPPPPPSGTDAGRLAAGGIYIKWQGRLWQEQPDGTYLVWEEGSHTWEKSVRQPPREGGAVQTKECPSCGRRIKSSFRVCPHCSHPFPTADRPAGVVRNQEPAWTPKPWYQKPVPNWVALILVAVVAASTVYTVYALRRGDPCASWDAANRAFARNAARAQGADPEGAALDSLIERYENRFSSQRPEGCS